MAVLSSHTHGGFPKAGKADQSCANKGALCTANGERVKTLAGGRQGGGVLRRGVGGETPAPCGAKSTATEEKITVRRRPITPCRSAPPDALSLSLSAGLSSAVGLLPSYAPRKPPAPQAKAGGGALGASVGVPKLKAAWRRQKKRQRDGRLSLQIERGGEGLRL